MGLRNFWACSYLGINSLTQCYYDTFFSLSNSCAFQANFLEPPVSRFTLLDRPSFQNAYYQATRSYQARSSIIKNSESAREHRVFDRHFPHIRIKSNKTLRIESFTISIPFYIHVIIWSDTRTRTYVDNLNRGQIRQRRNTN